MCNVSGFNINTFMAGLKKTTPTAKNPKITPRHRELQLLELQRMDKGRSASPALGFGALKGAKP